MNIIQRNTFRTEFHVVNRIDVNKKEKYRVLITCIYLPHCMNLKICRVSISKITYAMLLSTLVIDPKWTIVLHDQVWYSKILTLFLFDQTLKLRMELLAFVLFLHTKRIVYRFQRSPKNFIQFIEFHSEIDSISFDADHIERCVVGSPDFVCFCHFLFAYIENIKLKSKVFKLKSALYGI